MKTALKIITGLVGVLVLGVIVIAVGLYFISNSFIGNSYEVAAEAIQIPSDEETIAHGEHIATSRGCTDCHGDHRLRLRTVRWDKKTGKLLRSGKAR